MPVQRWRCPVALQVKSAILAAAGVAVAKVFFPLWFAVPVMAVLAVWGLGMCVRPGEVVVDADAGVVVVGMGPLRRRIRLGCVAAVRVDRGKVSLARSDGGEISVYVWRKSRLDGWLRMPVEAGDVGHAIARAAAAATVAPIAAAAAAAEAPAPRDRGRGARQTGALTVLGCAGAAALGAAFLVRVGWPNPVMTVAGVALALALGVSGVFYVVSSLWLFLVGRPARAARAARDEAGTA